MEKIIKKAIEGGWKNFFLRNSSELNETNFMIMTLSPLFWQALGKSCGWAMTIFQTDSFGSPIGKTYWMRYALNFHEINLTEGWSAAVSYLSEVTK